MYQGHTEIARYECGRQTKVLGGESKLTDGRMANKVAWVVVINHCTETYFWQFFYEFCQNVNHKTPCDLFISDHWWGVMGDGDSEYIMYQICTLIFEVNCIYESSLQNKKSGAVPLRVSVLLDHMRGSRGEKNSRTMLLPLLQDFGSSVTISLYHTPTLRGVVKSLLPERYNETVGVNHIKAYIFDDTVVISGWVNLRLLFCHLPVEKRVCPVISVHQDVIWRKAFRSTSFKPAMLLSLTLW